MPDSSSRATRFSLSTSFCIFLKRGSATANSTRISPSIRTSASASTHARLMHFERPITSPPMPMMGAKHIMRRPIDKNICTCCTSFVERVIRLAVEKRSISALLK